MAVSMARFSLRSASLLLRQGANGSAVAPAKRSFSASAHMMTRGCEVTYAGIATCTILTIYNLSKGHPHHEEPPAYPYLHIRNKEFPWGPDGLFEKKHHDH